MLIADDQALFRQGLVRWLDHQHDLSIVAETECARHCFELALRLRPDLVVVDPRIGGIDDLDRLAALRYRGAGPAVVVLTSSARRHEIVRALDAGVAEYLTKDMNTGILLDAMRRVLSLPGGQAVHAKELLQRHTDIGWDAQRDRVALTARECQVIELLSAGMSNKRIALALDISEGTVKVHLRNMKRKIGHRSRVEIALWARRRTEISPNEP